MKTRKYGKVLIFAVLFTLLAFIITGVAQAATITVCPSGCDYSGIQEAVNAANPMDTIEVYSGTYYETVNINKRLTLQGVDTGGGKPVVDAGVSGSAIMLSADGIMLEGFKAINSGWGHAGIKVSSNNNTIINNIASSNNKDGIFLYYSNNNTITDNIASNNNHFGIDLWYSSNNTLRNNLMSGSHHNFGAHGESESELENDIDTSNLVDGKLIYYLIGASNIVIDPSSNAGTVYCINCNNVTLKDLILTNNGYGIYFYNTSNSRIINISSNCYNNIWLVFSNDNTITGNNASNSYYGIFLGHSSNNILRNNLMSGNQYNFEAWGWGDLEFENNIDTSNFVDGKPIYYLVGVSGTVIDSSSNAGTVYCISCNNVKVKDLTFSNNGKGVCFHNTCDSRIQNIHASNNIVGICLDSSNNNIITGNNVSNNHRYGILLFIHSSSSNKIHLNNFMHNAHNVESYSSCSNIWNSTEPITYQYSGSSFTNYLGNYWSDYTGSDADGDGIGDTPYSIEDSDKDNYPLWEPFENYNHLPTASFTYFPEKPVVNQTITFDASSSYDLDGQIVSYEWNFGDGTNRTEEIVNHSYSSPGNYMVNLTVTDDDGAMNSTNKTLIVYPLAAGFDTGAPANPYPSIFGTHNGTIKPSHDVFVQKMYTYSCSGTGGHSKYVRIYRNGLDVNGTWNGYQGGDYHYMVFDMPFTLYAGLTYNYTIRTGSYPQIHHNRTLTVPDGEITCSEFIDANGKTYTDWIPAIGLE